MKTNLLKEYLIKAIQNTPEDFALLDVRTHLKTALSKLENIEKKRSKKEFVSNDNNWIISNGTLMHPKEAKKAIKIIDELIKIENSKIEDLKKKKENDNDGQLQTFFG